MQSGVIYVRASQDGIPTILFSNFPSPNVEVSYQEASNRLLSLVDAMLNMMKFADLSEEEVRCEKFVGC